MNAAPGAGSFIVREGATLTQNGYPYTFTGMNVYNANTRVHSCWYPFDGALLGESLTAMGPGVDAVRAWFFQDFATTDGLRDWTAFDLTIATAKAHGKRVIVTLGNHWADCDSEGEKTAAWYGGGYGQKPAALPASYRDYVAEVVARYTDEPAVLMWQLLNEAEVPIFTPEGLCDEPTAHLLLKGWAEDVSALIKSIDPIHLVSIGTIGSGQCGAQFTDYKALHEIASVDLCEFHDYGTEVMPGDQWNGLAFRLQQCAELGKPLFVGETGINPAWLDGTLQARASLFAQKLSTQFEAGVVGEVVWAWNAFESRMDTYDIGPGDATLDVLATFSADATYTATIASPPDGAVYPRGEAIRSDVACTAKVGTELHEHPCYTKDVLNPGDLVDTWNAGAHTFTVQAIDEFDNVAATDVHTYQVLPSAPRLTGERLDAGPAFSFLGATTFAITADCNPAGQSTVSYTATGRSIGPFAGTFTETGTLTIGPQYTDPGQGVAYGAIESFSASFSIDSAAGTVTGTKSLIPTPERKGYCVTPSAGSPFSGVNVSNQPLSYQAQITTAEGTARDDGTTLLGWYFACSSSCSDVFEVREFAGSDWDIDNDGVVDSIDAGIAAFTTGATSGSVVDAAGNLVWVAPAPSGGARITVGGSANSASVLICGLSMQLAAGSDVIVACGSITTKVLRGAATLLLGDGLASVSITAGVTAFVAENADGSYTVTHLAGSDPILITVDGVTATVNPGATLTLEAWDFTGFAKPVTNDGVYNAVRAGQTVPLKWRLVRADGGPVTDLVNATLRVASLACEANATSDGLEEVAAGGSGLQNLGDGYYQLNWKVPKSYGDSCKTLHLVLGDGVTHTAVFRITR